MIDIKGLVEARLRAYDPLIDLSENGFAQEIIIKPIVKAFGSDPMATDIRTFLITKFNELYPDTTLSNGDAVSDILISVSQLFFEAYRLELQTVKNSLSIDFLNQMSEGDADALAANWLVTRRLGTKASGTVRVVVNRLATISIDATNLVRSISGVIFAPSNIETIDTSLLLTNRLANGNYYFDLNVTAVLDGVEGNIPVGSIASIANINGLVSISNLVAFSGGSDSEDNQALLRDRLPRSATERSLVTKRGIVARIENYTKSVNSVEVVGFGDIEMTRDAVDFQDRGPFKAFGVGYTIGKLMFLTVDNVKVTLNENDVIRSTDGTKFLIVKVVGEQNSAVLMDTGKSFIIYTDVDSGIGGKALLLNIESAPTIKIGHEIFEDEVHLGGKSDVYIEPASFTDISTVFSETEFTPIISGFGFEIVGNKIVINEPLIIDKGAFIQTDDGVFRILHSVVAQNKTSIFIGQELDNGIFVSFWRIFGKLSINISNKETTILGINSGIIGTITEAGIVLLNQDIPVLVNIGDIIVLPNSLRFRIIAIYSDRMEVEQRPLQLILNQPIKFIRVSTTSILPASDIFGLTVSNKAVGSNRCLGLEPINVYGAKTLSRGIGFVSRCLLDMFISPDRSSKAQLPLIEFSKSSFKIRHLRRDKIQVAPEYNVDSRFDIGEYGGGYGYLDEDMSVAIFVGGKSSLEFWNDDEALFNAQVFNRMFYLEVPLFNDMLVEGANNVFIALGDGVTDYEFPIFNFLRGNILRIDDGLNKGNYIIDKVLNIRLPNNFENLRPIDDRWRKPILVSGNIQINENGFGNEQYSVYTITYNLNSSQASDSLFRNISIVKIKGRFPVNPFDILNSQIDPSVIVRNINRNELFPGNQAAQDPGLNLFDFSRISDIFINQIKSTTIKTILDADATRKVFELINAKFRGVLGGLNELTQFDEAFLEKLYKVQYTYGSPAKGEANIFLEDNVVTRLRPVPTQKYLISDINNGVRNRVDKKLPAVKILKDVRSWFYAEKNDLTLVLADEASFSVIGSGSFDNKKTWKRGLNVERVFAPLLNFSLVEGRSDIQADIVKFDNALEIISDYNEASVSVCKEIFVQKRFVRSVDQVFLPYIPIHVPNQAFRNALVQAQDIFSANDVTNTQEFLNCANRLNGDGVIALDLVNYYLALGTYIFLKIDQATYEQDPESIKNLPLTVQAIFQNTAFLPGNNYDERNNFWKDSTDVQASDLMFYGYLDDDTEITGITLAEVSKFSNELRLVSPIANPSTTYSFSDIILSADIYVEQNGELLDIYNADGYDQQTGTIKLTKPMAFTTPRIYNVGRIFYTVDNELVLYGFQGIQFGEDNVFTYVGNLRSQGNESGLLLDVTRSFLTDNDVGRFITIFNYVQSPEYTGVNGPDAFVPIRQHIGCYKILGVNSVVRRSQFTGKDVVVSQKLVIADFPNLLSFKGFNRLQADDTEPLALSFVITDAPEVTPTVNDDGTTSITTLLPVQIYARSATNFDIIASALDNKSVGVKIIADNSIPSIDKVEPFLFVNNMNNLNMSFNKNNPFIFSTRSFLTLDTYEMVGGMYAAKIKFQSLGLDSVYNLIQGEGFDTYNEEIDGYRVISKDLEVARTTKENLYLEIPPRVFDVSPLSSDITIKSATNFAISVVESIFASDERVICSDTLVKEKVRSYLGADIRYVGNVLEKTVVDAIIKVFNNALLSNTPISISSLVQYLHRLGVSRVIMPIRLYHIVVDLDRRVYYRPIKDVLHPNTDLDILATARLLMTLVPSYNQTIHGAKIVATRVLDTTLIG